MHSFLPKALVVLTLWSGTGLAVTTAQIAEASEQPALSCIAGDASAPVASTCQSYADAVTAALAAG
ncbi:MAG: hypothetical protein ACREEA_07255 [Stellaceae bacterium]